MMVLFALLTIIMNRSKTGKVTQFAQNCNFKCQHWSCRIRLLENQVFGRMSATEREEVNQTGEDCMMRRLF